MTIEKPLDERLRDFEERMKKRKEAEDAKLEEEQRKLRDRLTQSYLHRTGRKEMKP